MSEVSAKLQEFQDRLGYQFSDRRIYIQALTHTSYGHEFQQNLPIALRDNERLEFLGDAILDVVISDILLEVFPQANEGQLSKMRAAVVNENTLAELTRTLGLSDCLRLGKGEIQTGGADKPSILSSTFEAIIAAIYIDGGFHAIYPVIRHLFRPLFNEDADFLIFQDHKTQLQEVVQARFKVTPTYHLTSSHGPDHAKIFEIVVKMREEVLAVGQGSSKKLAEKNAARNALMSLSTKED